MTDLSACVHIIGRCDYKSLFLIDATTMGLLGGALFESVAEYPQIFESLPITVLEGISVSNISRRSVCDAVVRYRCRTLY